ncbi:MAG: Lrp/AsnC family transcriptional regulator [Desulfobacterales bacterium]|nr:Lrp/AsnC family transcriptional regulator [Desulfobacterales bacterium]
MINNIRATFATTLKVLEHLEAALVQAGFAEGRDAYRKMVDTIIGQSLWLTAQGCDLCTDEMARLQSRARAIHALLHPYTETMLRLGAMGGSALAAVAEASADATETPAEPVLAILSRNARPMSITALRAELGCPRKELVSRLAELERHGKVKRQANGGRELFSLRGPA